MPSPPPQADAPDSSVWIPEISEKFSIKSAWNSSRAQGDLVCWSSLVWFSGRIPKAAFCLWLAIREPLYTQDRWFIYDPTVRCLLCNAQLENHHHLFFECPISSQIWRSVQNKGVFNVPAQNWFNMIEWISTEWRNDNLTHQSWKLSLAVTVYIIWQERNSRLHGKPANGITHIIEKIFELIRIKLSSLKGLPTSSANRGTAAIWNLPDSIFDK